MEVANAVFIPSAMLLVAISEDTRIGLLSGIAIIPMSVLLLLGGFYWRGKMLKMQGRPTPLRRVLAWADRLQWILLVLVIAASIAVAAAWVSPAISASLADRICATIAAVLAGLEYINYYHRQLQHFDHFADLKKLFSGQGFRPAQMAVDLKRFRKAG